MHKSTDMGRKQVRYDYTYAGYMYGQSKESGCVYGCKPNAQKLEPRIESRVRTGDKWGRRSPRPKRMTYFVVDVKIEVVDMKVFVPTELELHELDLPRGRYGL